MIRKTTLASGGLKGPHYLQQLHLYFELLRWTQNNLATNDFINSTLKDITETLKSLHPEIQRLKTNLRVEQMQFLLHCLQ